MEQIVSRGEHTEQVLYFKMYHRFHVYITLRKQMILFDVFTCGLG